MTRINVVPPEELCDQHLLAEHRELTRIPSAVARANGNVVLSTEHDYILGTGHVRFFYDKLAFLSKRYSQIHAECLGRNFKVTVKWPEQANAHRELFGDYNPTPAALELNRARIAIRMPKKPRFSGFT